MPCFSKWQIRSIPKRPLSHTSLLSGRYPISINTLMTIYKTWFFFAASFSCEQEQRETSCHARQMTIPMMSRLLEELRRFYRSVIPRLRFGHTLASNPMAREERSPTNMSLYVGNAARLWKLNRGTHQTCIHTWGRHTLEFIRTWMLHGQRYRHRGRHRQHQTDLPHHRERSQKRSPATLPILGTHRLGTNIHQQWHTFWPRTSSHFGQWSEKDSFIFWKNSTPDTNCQVGSISPKQPYQRCTTK